MNKEDGSGMISVLVALAIMTIVGFIVAQIHETSTKTSSSVDSKYDIIAVKHLINNTLDCEKTLGINSGTALPLNCSAYSNVRLRNKFGKEIFPGSTIGPWQVATRCSDNHLVVSVVRSGNDRLTSKAYSSKKEAVDLFDGVSRFCVNHFTAKTLSEYGGTYQRFKNSVGIDFGCRISNYLTGSCGCASGTHPVLISEMVSNFRGTCTYYSDRSGACGYGAYLCVRR